MGGVRGDDRAGDNNYIIGLPGHLVIPTHRRRHDDALRSARPTTLVCLLSIIIVRGPFSIRSGPAALTASLPGAYNNSFAYGDCRPARGILLYDLNNHVLQGDRG
eukprot:8834121-Pyramimonas_sp.AAC.2